MNRFAVLCFLLAPMSFAHADVSVTDTGAAARGHGRASASTTTVRQAKPGDKRNGIPLDKFTPKATGSQALVDASGLKYFINTNITFSTSSSASGAMSEASYTHAVAATTLNGGTVASTLNDAFDGYNTLCLSLDNSVATCETGNSNFAIYNKNGPATTECTGTASGVNRQVVFPTQTSGSIAMSRKVFVPDNDSFARWLNYFTNTGATAQTVTMVIANNLGSDSNTIITNSSTGSTTSPFNDTTATWVATFQNYSGTTSSDPRQAAVLQGPGATVPLAGINFANGDDNPYWGYTFTLQPGQTRIIANFVALGPSKAAVAAKASSLASLPTNAVQCMSAQERAELVNFAAATPSVPAPGPGRLALGLLIALLIAIGFLALRPRLQ
jgi:hypothetical protein